MFLAFQERTYSLFFYPALVQPGFYRLQLSVGVVQLFLYLVFFLLLVFQLLFRSMDVLQFLSDAVSLLVECLGMFFQEVKFLNGQLGKGICRTQLESQPKLFLIPASGLLYNGRFLVV